MSRYKALRAKYKSKDSSGHEHDSSTGQFSSSSGGKTDKVEEEKPKRGIVSRVAGHLRELRHTGQVIGEAIDDLI